MGCLKFSNCIAAAIAIASTAASAQKSKVADQVILHAIQNPIRSVAFDLCYPSSSEEYEALGKHAILQLKSASAIGTELPLRSAYVLLKGVRVPLQRISLIEKQEVPPSGQVDTAYVRQTSYYLVPIYLLKTDARVLVDFRGARTAFGVTSYSSKEAPENAPSFVRLDEYDTPSDPDMAVVAKVLAREYPEDF